MERTLKIGSYSADRGLQLEWSPGFEIDVQLQSGEIVIRANKTGLISLAQHMLTLAEDSVPKTTTKPGLPPTGSRDNQFVVGVYADVLNSEEVSVVGHDPSQGPEDDWPPPYRVRDPILGAMKIYHHGLMRNATPEECVELESAAVWDFHHLVDRLMGIRRGPE